MTSEVGIRRGGQAGGKGEEQAEIYVSKALHSD